MICFIFYSMGGINVEKHDLLGSLDEYEKMKIDHNIYVSMLNFLFSYIKYQNF